MKRLILVCLVFAMPVHAAEVECRVSALNRECGEAMSEPHTPEARKGWRLEGVTIKKDLTVPGYTEQHCEADIDVSYVQMNDRVRVDTTINTDKCGAAGGEYELLVRTYNQGESVTRNFPQTWQRVTDERLELTEYISMEGASKLGWVRVKSDVTLACICEEEPTQEDR